MNPSELNNPRMKLGKTSRVRPTMMAMIRLARKKTFFGNMVIRNGTGPVLRLKYLPFGIFPPQPFDGGCLRLSFNLRTNRVSILNSRILSYKADLRQGGLGSGGLSRGGNARGRARAP